MTSASPPDQRVENVYRALKSRKLGGADLTTRRVCAFLGETTGALYHHYGSLDGFLFVVSQRGYVDLAAQLDKAFSRAEDVADIAESFVRFGLDHPELYPIMFERHFDWAALRERGAFDRPLPSAALLVAVTGALARAGSVDVAVDGRLLFAGLHGLVSLAASGRANVGALSVSDRDIAVTAARTLAARLVPKKPWSKKS